MNKVALITGAARGIGAAVALKLAQDGYDIVLNYRTSQQDALSLAEKLETLGVRVLPYCADVGNSDEVNAMVEAAVARFGSITALVNNAGIAAQTLFTDISEEQWRKMLNTHVDGAYHCCKAVLPSMIRDHAGKIVNISSVWGISGASCEVHYSTAKAALIGMTKALAKEVGPSNIQVNCVAPGVIQTDMLAAFNDEDLRVLEEQTPLCRLGTPADVANAVSFLLSEQADFITGQVLAVDGGFCV